MDHCQPSVAIRPMLGLGVAVDRFGNSFVVGETSGDLVSPNAGDGDVFVTKFDADGVMCGLDRFRRVAGPERTTVRSLECARFIAALDILDSLPSHCERMDARHGQLVLIVAAGWR